ncbi:MAG: EAL and HDOD domain-containing protein [Acidobacteriota bacterium]
MDSILNNDSSVPRPAPNRFLARQPILDRRQRILGYEILFRAGWMNSFSGDGDDATRQILDNLFVAGVDSVCGRKLAFVNCTRESLLSGLVTLLPVQSTVLEILETVEPDDEIVAACRALKAKGYRIALDDFVMRDSMAELVKLADYIKIDVRNTDSAERNLICQNLRNSGVSLLAEKVETEAEFRAVSSEGFTAFQGYFFCSPVMIARHEIPPNRLNALKLLCAVSRSPLDLDELEVAVKSDPALCYRLLQLANSPLYPIHGRIRNVRSAAVLLGEREIRKLAIVALATSFGSESADALLHLCLQRARFCELIAPTLNLSESEQYMLGLLSAADAFLALPMATIVDRLPLRGAIRSALLGMNNPEARALWLARRFETGDWESVADRDFLAYLDYPELAGAYSESVRWTESALSRTPSSARTAMAPSDLCSCPT